jgi:hypothetical protein
MAKKTTSAKKTASTKKPEQDALEGEGRSRVLWVVVAVVAAALLCGCCLLASVGWTYGDQIVQFLFSS